MLKSACISKAVSRPCASADDLRPDARGMPLGGGGHRLGARVDDAHRPPASPTPPPPAAAAPRRRACRRSRRRRRSGGCARARVDAQHARGLLAVHVGRLRAGGDLDAVGPGADGHRVAGLRLDVGVLDEGGLEAPLGRRGRARRARPPRRRTCRLPRVSTLSATRGVDALARLAPAPRRCRTSGVAAVQAIGSSASDMPSTAARVPTSASTASPRKRTWPGASTGWSLSIGKDAEGVLARHVARRSGSPTRPGVRALDRVEIAEREARAGVRRAHDAHPQRVGGGLVGAEQVGAGHLGPAVDARQARADGRHAPPAGSDPSAQRRRSATARARV